MMKCNYELLWKRQQTEHCALRPAKNNKFFPNKIQHSGR